MALGNPVRDDVQRICHDSDAQIVVQTEDYDLFVTTQRDAVKALQHHEAMISSADSLRQSIHAMFSEIRRWGASQKAVSQVAWTPRPDDALVIVTATNEDEEGKLHAVMAELDLLISEQYAFRVSFLLLRASEASGISSFGDEEMRPIYEADPSATSLQG